MTGEFRVSKRFGLNSGSDSNSGLKLYCEDKVLECFMDVKLTFSIHQTNPESAAVHLSLRRLLESQAAWNHC